ncbi:putative vacuolar protein sorting-associated protein 13A isoform X1 [Cucumis melo var. makuwa]|uniref:Putative vacuolar protein sorting-associated protein 13A isoform X1 n=1 Tax=Cucumis melo var. makuwa TaxID=1194695 RepID=A0A5D3E3H0_CUCMM|nr:putative vacuolar protein sorting-associated protein 13A isoform X1 [Cucumis melo var. makuwa]
MPDEVVSFIERIIWNFLWEGHAGSELNHSVKWDRFSERWRSWSGRPEEKKFGLSCKMRSLAGWGRGSQVNKLVEIIGLEIYCSCQSAVDVEGCKEARGAKVSTLEEKSDFILAPCDAVLSLMIEVLANFRIGNGSGVYFWNDPWLDNIPLNNKFPRLLRIALLPKGSITEQWNCQTSSQVSITDDFLKCENGGLGELRALKESTYLRGLCFKGIKLCLYTEKKASLSLPFSTYVPSMLYESGRSSASFSSVLMQLIVGGQVDCSVRLVEVNRSGKLDNSTPQYSVKADLSSLVFTLNDVQLQQILNLWDYLSICRLRDKSFLLISFWSFCDFSMLLMSTDFKSLHEVRTQKDFAFSSLSPLLLRLAFNHILLTSHFLTFSFIYAATVCAFEFVMETKSCFFGACSFKAKEKHYQCQQSFRFLFPNGNPDLMEVCSSLVQALGFHTRLPIINISFILSLSSNSDQPPQMCRVTLNSQTRVRTKYKEQYGNANLEEAGSLNAHETQDSDVESVVRVSSEELEEVEVGEEAEDSEILENIINDFLELFVEEGMEEEQPPLQKFREEIPQHLLGIIEACGISFV